MPPPPLLLGVVLASAICLDLPAQQLLETHGPTEWTATCDTGTIRVTLRIYDNSSVTPQTNKWDYEFQNVSFDPQESVGPRGLTNWSTNPAWAPATRMSELTPPGADWSFWVDQGPYLQALMSEAGSGFTPGQTLHFTFVVGSEYPAVEDLGWGEHLVYTGLGLIEPEGPPGCESYGGYLSVTIQGPMMVPGKRPMRLKTLGWPTTAEDDSRQTFWVTSTLGSNGDPLQGDQKTQGLVYEDLEGNGQATINHPVAFQHGWQGSAHAVLWVDHVRDHDPVTINIEVSPPDFTVAPIWVTVNDGLASLPQIAMAGPFPDHVLNQTYTFKWSMWFDGEETDTLTTTHKVYLMHDTVTLPTKPGFYNITSKRLDHVTSIAKEKKGLAAIADTIQNELEPRFDGASHLSETERFNVWSWFDKDPRKVDCESLAALGAAELQQIGFPTAVVKLAYATGAYPEGDTNAMTQESRTEALGVYSLVYPVDNYFEGYIELEEPGQSELRTLTIAPKSPLLSQTQCTVQPSEEDNRRRFRVLTHTLSHAPTPHNQQWMWDFNSRANYGKNPTQQEVYLPGLFLFPRVGCPVSEGGTQ